MKQIQKEGWQKMRQNQAAYAAFEKKILDLYERKVLTPGLLEHVARQYQQFVIDSAGCQPLQTRDGKEVCQVCIELVDPSFPIVARGSREDHEEYWEQELKKWEEIMYGRWRWRRARASFPIHSRQDTAA